MVSWLARRFDARAFSLLLGTGERSEVRLFLRKSRDVTGHSVNTKSENALAAIWILLLNPATFRRPRRKVSAMTGALPAPAAAHA
jgi:hypothetical protein